MIRFCFGVLLLAITTGKPASLRATQAPVRVQSESHIDWVTEVLIRMQTVKLGMTRNELLKIFTTEGGISTGLRRTFVSRDCPFFKVDVEFRAVGRPSRDQDRRVTLQEDGRDVIVKISKPYLEFGGHD
jgi:hypothetical protein